MIPRLWQNKTNDGAVLDSPAPVGKPPVTYTLADQNRMTQAKNYFAWQSRLVNRELGRRVVEVGCGVGNFTETLLDLDLVVALDIERECVEALLERYSDRSNLHAFVLDASCPDFRRLFRYGLDSCVCLNVLEHIEEDVRTLEAMGSILVPGGVIVLIVPAFQSLYGPIDRNLGHYRRYSRASIHRAAQDAGLRVKKAHYMNLVGFFGWWTNAHILRREAQSEKQISAFDRYVVPVISRVEAVIRPWCGQSLFVVLEKP
jgi:SAM-dependent methyltransferase